MSDQSESTLAALRWSWFVLLALVVLLVWLPAGPWWVVPSALLWLAGAWLLGHPRRSRVLARTWSDAVAAAAPRAALVVLLGLLVLVMRVFSILAAVALLLVLGIAVLTLAAAGTSRTVRETLAGMATLGVTLVLVLGAGELLFRSPMLARRFGAPAEIRAWNTNRYDKLWTRNLFAIRSPYEHIAKAPGMRRVIALGDSYTWGDKIAKTDSTWPARLERELRTEHADSTIQVVNMAQRGYTTANEAEVLRRLGWQFDPDLVVVQFLANDALPSYPNLGREDTKWLVPWHPLLPWRLTTGAVSSSALYAFLQGQYNKLRQWRHPFYEAFDQTFQPGSSEWSQVRSALREMADSACVRHVPIVLALFPMFIPGQWSVSTYPLRNIHEQVAREARADGFHVLDLTPVFAAQGGEWQRWWATPYDGHPSAAAHAVAADAISRYLGQQHLLGDRISTLAFRAADAPHACSIAATARPSVDRSRIR